MTFQLIAIDLDGTLLDSQHAVPPENAAAIQACLDRGIMIVVATGRLFASAGVYFQQLGLTGPVITLNGAAVIDGATGALQAGHFLDNTILQMVSDELQQREIPFTVFGPEGIYSLPDMPHHDILKGYGEPDAIIVDTVNTTTIPHPGKVLTFLREGPEEIVLRKRLQGPTEVVRTAPIFLEFLSPGVSKGAALAEIMARNNITSDAVLAIGDSYNDLSMFDVAGMSVAMGGADAPIQARASAVTNGCDEAGVAAALRRFVLDA